MKTKKTILALAVTAACALGTGLGLAQGQTHHRLGHAHIAQAAQTSAGGQSLLCTLPGPERPSASQVQQMSPEQLAALCPQP